VTPVNAPAWLIERPIAHRGLHDEAKGVIENTLAATAKPSFFMTIRLIA
jgi:glycerophosphoryl diester phosphodiesterase